MSIEHAAPVAHEAPSLGLADVMAAAKRLQNLVHRTPVLVNRTINQRAGGHEIFFKCEHLQKTGSFKFRGASHAIACLAPEELARGVVTHSSGNHAGALACAAQRAGIPAWVVMPRGSNPVKRNAVLAYGGQVVTCDNNEQARMEVAQRVQADTGANLVPPFDDPRIIAGQGTATLELIEEVPDLDVVIAPVGGGGLLAGTALAARGICDQIRVIAAEPAGANDAWQSFQQHRRIPLTSVATIADGLRTSLGLLNWPIIQRLVECVVTISEAEIIETTRMFWMLTKSIIEPSSAVAVAALFQSPLTELPRPSRIGVILSGGNVDFDHLPWTAKS